MANDNLLFCGKGTRTHADSPLLQSKSSMNYLDRIGAKLTSMTTAAIFTEGEGGYEREVNRVYFFRDGTVKAKKHLRPTEKEKEEIKAEILLLKFPTFHPIFCEHGGMPPEVAKVPEKDRFAFTQPDGRNGMFLIRLEKPSGEKYYHTYTHWSDSKWRLAEPDGLLPIWGLDQLKKQVSVFIHEGAKSARFCADVASGKIKRDDPALKHWPWFDMVQHGAHVGWVGGALRPHLTDWASLKKLGPQRIFIVADNDRVGKAAVPAIAKAIGLRCTMVAFTDQFPEHYDLADPVPAKLFIKRADGADHYTGPSLLDLMQPATWATRLVEKPIGEGFDVKLRPEFIDDWVYISVVERFVNRRYPQHLWTAQQVNANTAPFADKCDVAKLLLQSAVQQIHVTTYYPVTIERVVNFEGTTAFNSYRPSRIRPVAGDVGPFLEFMAYLIPNEHECHHALRWIATLVAKPGTRMGYAVILCSETQGTGKSTLATAILEPLVGEHNVSRPTASELQKSSFNGWMKDRRLAIIEEIYEGHSWTVYNKLKAYITEKKLRVNEKYIAEVEQPNWIHMFATSNQMAALKMQREDRRWLMPRVTEQLWEAGKFTALRKWLETGGLENIAYWAENFDDYVQPGEHAPMTSLKHEVIAWSRDPKEQEALRIAEMLNTHPSPVALDRKSIDRMIAEALRDDKRYSDASAQKVRKALEEGGLRMWDKPMKIGDQKADIFLSSHVEWEAILGDPNVDKLGAVRQRLYM